MTLALFCGIWCIANAMATLTTQLLPPPHHFRRPTPPNPGAFPVLPNAAINIPSGPIIVRPSLPFPLQARPVITPKLYPKVLNWIKMVKPLVNFNGIQLNMAMHKGMRRFIDPYMKKKTRKVRRPIRILKQPPTRSLLGFQRSSGVKVNRFPTLNSNRPLLSGGLLGQMIRPRHPIQSLRRHNADHIYDDFDHRSFRPEPSVISTSGDFTNFRRFPSWSQEQHRQHRNAEQNIKNTYPDFPSSTFGALGSTPFRQMLPLNSIKQSANERFIDSFDHKTEREQLPFIPDNSRLFGAEASDIAAYNQLFSRQEQRNHLQVSAPGPNNVGMLNVPSVKIVREIGEDMDDRFLDDKDNNDDIRSVAGLIAHAEPVFAGDDSFDNTFTEETDRGPNSGLFGHGTAASTEGPIAGLELLGKSKWDDVISEMAKADAATPHRAHGEHLVVFPVNPHSDEPFHDTEYLDLSATREHPGEHDRLSGLDSDAFSVLGIDPKTVGIHGIPTQFEVEDLPVTETAVHKDNPIESNTNDSFK